MKNFSYYYYCLFFLVSLIPLTTRAQQTFHTTSQSVIGYLEYLPQDYNSNSDTYPIVIFLHGLGERGATSTDPAVLSGTISAVNKNGPPKYTSTGTQFPFILISPQLKSNFTDWPVWYVNEVIDYCKTYLRIDERRIYLTGLSLGGGGTWSVADDFPTSFAAIAPVCGSRISVPKACNLAGENLPVWAFHGDADTTVPASRSIAMVNAINACTPAPNPLAKITIYPGVGHNAWDNAYLPDHSIHNPNVYEWLLSYTNTTNGSNQIPIANAGIDASTVSTNVVMSGSGSDSDGTIDSYAWTQLAGPSTALLSNASTATLTASNMIVGVYIFKLKVTDNVGDFSADYVKVTVQNISNIPPITNAGADKTLVLPTNSVTIAGTATDPDGTIASYQWSEVSGPAAVLSGITTTTLAATSLTSGAYVFRLTAKDNLGATKSDDVVVNVTPASTNMPPVVSAGPDRIISLPLSEATLFGTASDPDGTIASFRWTEISGGSYTITSPDVLRPKISNFSSGTYVFRITVTDNNGAVSTDDVTIQADYPATANAGPDLSITLPANTITLNGSATDSDGTVASYLWSNYSGPSAATLTNRDTKTVTASKLVTGIYVFKLTVTDNIGVQSVDYATVIVITLGGRSASIDDPALVIGNNSTAGVQTEADVFILADKNNSSIENSIATIYDENGSKIFEGTWNASLYDQVFNQKGLYIYNLSKDGHHTRGKLYVTESY